MPLRVLIPDFGMGNLHSVRRSLIRLNIEPVVSQDAKQILYADKIILPGVGHFGKAMENLAALHMIDELHEHALVRKKPILGICLGMQLMSSDSEEGNVNGLGWIDAHVKRFQVTDTLRFKVPHVGWNKIIATKFHPLLQDIPPGTEFYFLHSYHVHVSAVQDELTHTVYESSFSSAISKENICGVQFHPEKSHQYGSRLLQNFIKY